MEDLELEDGEGRARIPGMPELYRRFADFIARHTAILIVLILAAGAGIPAWAVFEEELGRPGKGVIGFIWWLVCTTIWFDSKDRSKGVEAWVAAFMLDVFVVLSLWLLVS